MKKLISLFTVLVNMMMLVCATDYYVSPTGDDNNSGTTPSSAWKTISKVNSEKFSGGDVIAFEGGQTFTGSIFYKTFWDGGTLTYTSYGTGRATIDAGNGKAFDLQDGRHYKISNINIVGNGRNNGNTDHGVYAYNTPFLIIEHVDVSGFQKTGIRMEYSNDVTIQHVDAHDNGGAGIHVQCWRHKNLLVRHCNAYNNPGDPTVTDTHTGSGILIGGMDSSLVEYCTATNNGWGMTHTGSGGPVGIWFYDCDYMTVQYCISYRNKSIAGAGDGGGFDWDGGCRYCVMQYCLSYENEGSGYGLFQYPGANEWKDNTVRYCISYNDGTRNHKCGLNFWDGNNKGNMSKAKVYNNLIINEKNALNFAGGIPDSEFYNNIFIFRESFTESTLHTGKHQYVNNLYWKTGGGFESNGYTSFTDWANFFKVEQISGKIVGMNADPLLLNFQNFPDITDPMELHILEQFKLMKGSPAINKGLNLQDYAGIDPGMQDFYGKTAPSAGNFDLGVDESFHGATSDNPPVASFIAEANIVEEDSSIIFTDNSSNEPTSFKWFFEGGEPSVSSSANPVVKYDSNGVYDVTLIVTNGFGSDTLTKSDYIRVNPGSAWNKMDDKSTLLTYQGNWKTATTAGAYQSTEHNTTLSGSSVFLKFRGSKFRLYGFKGPDKGIAQIFINGALTGSVDCYDPVLQGDIVLYESDILSDGIHTIKIVNSGKKSSASKGTVINIDAFELYTDVLPPKANFEQDRTSIEIMENVSFSDNSLNEPTSWLWTFEGGVPGSSTEAVPVVTYEKRGVFSVTLTVANSGGSDTLTVSDLITVNDGSLVWIKVDDNHSSVVYDENWSFNTGGDGYMTTDHFTSAKDAEVVFDFKGDNVRFYGFTGKDKGIADIYIDDVLIESVDCYSPSLQTDTLLFESDELTEGNHTIKVVNGRQGNPNSSGTALNIDAFEYTGDSIITSTSNIEKERVKLYPNPVGNRLNIIGMEKKCMYSIFSVTGENLLQGEGKAINVSTLIPGIYIIRVNREKQFKFIKQ